MKQRTVQSHAVTVQILAFVFLLMASAPWTVGQTSWTTDCSSVPESATRSVIWTPTLCQEFNGPEGPPDTSAWAFDLGNNNGWGNHEVEIYCGPPGYSNNPPPCPTSFNAATANAFVDGNGHLAIQVIDSGGNWYSARLKTQGVQNFLYGRIEASLKIPNTTDPGLWPAFWWLGSSCATVPWPDCGETDIMENWSPFVLNGPGPGHNRSTIHTALTRGPGITSAYAFPSGQQANTAFYAYGVIWSPNMLQFYVKPATTSQTSIQPFFIITASDLPPGDTWPFNASAFLLTNVAVGGTLGGPTTNTPSPDTMLIDYVRRYTPSSVPRPVLGSPPPIIVTAGGMTGNTSTLTPSIAPGTGYVYLSCSTTAPKAACSLKTNDPLNRFVVNSDADPSESVTVTVATTSNALAGPNFLKPKAWRPFLLVSFLLMILGMFAFGQEKRIVRTSSYMIALSLILAAIVIIGCGGATSGNTGGGSRGDGSSSTGTAPGNYTVTVYAFTEANASAGGNSNADASVAISLAVN